MLGKFAVVLGIVSVAAACSSQAQDTPEPVACTLIGCVNGLTLELRGNLPDTYTVTARAGTVVRTRECSTAQPCGQIVFEDFNPNTVTIEVTSAAGTVRREVTPEYRESRPNGPNCPPVCRQATVAVDV